MSQVVCALVVLVRGLVFPCSLLALQRVSFSPFYVVWLCSRCCSTCFQVLVSQVSKVGNHVACDPGKFRNLNSLVGDSFLF